MVCTAGVASRSFVQAFDERDMQREGAQMGKAQLESHAFGLLQVLIVFIRIILFK